MQEGLGRRALPFGSQAFSVKSVEQEWDTIVPLFTCKYIRDYKANITGIVFELDQKYSDTLQRFADAMQSQDPVHAKSAYTV